MFIVVVPLHWTDAFKSCSPTEQVVQWKPGARTLPATASIHFCRKPPEHVSWGKTTVWTSVQCHEVICPSWIICTKGSIKLKKKEAKEKGYQPVKEQSGNHFRQQPLVWQKQSVWAVNGWKLGGALRDLRAWINSPYSMRLLVLSLKRKKISYLPWN